MTFASDELVFDEQDGERAFFGSAGRNGSTGRATPEDDKIELFGRQR
jgi:hypothetical protein